jgi:hypothetical protein
MVKTKQWIALLIALVLLLPIAAGQTGLAQDHQPDFGHKAVERAAQAQDLPVPLPEDCDDVTPPGGTPPACCLYGYVYHQGLAVNGATVHVESAHGEIDVTTAVGGASSDPYYKVNLGAAPLLVSPGEVITVTTGYAGRDTGSAFQAAPDGQQADLVVLDSPVFGTGTDGDLTVGNGQTVFTDGVRTGVQGAASAGQAVVPVFSTTGFAPGQEVLILQVQGTEAGNYEFGIIAGVGSGTLTLHTNLAHSYLGGGPYGVTLYQDPYYGGFSERFWAGYYRLDHRAIGNDTVSSLQVNGFVARLYKDVDYGGLEEIFAEDDPNLVDNPIGDNAASSLKVIRAATSQVAQVIRVPHYVEVQIDDGGQLTAHDWDGETGGVVCFRAWTIQVADGGRIDVSGADGDDEANPGEITAGGGFRGGSTPQQNHTDHYGCQGEGALGFGSGGTDGSWWQANSNGGGGGIERQPDHSTTGGGGGGHANEGEPPGAAIPGGNQSEGGQAIGEPEVAHLYLGAGGGGGGMYYNRAGSGGSGGGVVLVYAQALTVEGNVYSDGGAGGEGGDDWDNGGAGGGGGAGGSIKVIARTAELGDARVTAHQGPGGGGYHTAGGWGSVGRIRIEYDTLSGTTDPLASTQQVSLPPAAPTLYAIDNPDGDGEYLVDWSDADDATDYALLEDDDPAFTSPIVVYLGNTSQFTVTGRHAGTWYYRVLASNDVGDGPWSNVESVLVWLSPPEAAFTVDPGSGDIGTVFHFDASGSSDDEDPVTALEVHWDWEDDGVYDTPWSLSKTITHTYATTGTYTIRLEVRDTDGQTDSTTCSVTVGGQAAWAFLLYLDGDNNLYTWLQHALDDLEAAAANPNVTVLALLDGYGNGDTWRYNVQAGGVYQDGFNRWFMGELDMDNPQTLSDFVTWARTNYPADHTYLAVADHGRGTTGIAWDDTSGNDEFITVAELRTALQSATLDGAEPLDVVHYDACLMGMLENAYQVKDYAGYLVASENLGWSLFAYDRYAAGVAAATTPAQLAEAVVDEYYDALAGYPRTISALDLGQAGAVEDAVTALATALRVDLETYKYHVLNSRDAAQKFDSRDYFVIDLDDEYLDLYDLARLIAQNVPDAGVQAAAQGVMDAVTTFVVAERHESGYYQQYPYWDLDDAHGVAIYFPPASGGWDYNDYMSHVFRFTAEGQWDEFLLDYFGLMGLPPETPVDPGLPPMLAKPYVVYLPVIVR